MAAPEAPPKLEVIERSIARLLEGITRAGGYYTDGALIDRHVDPRVVRKNRPEEFNAKSRAITVSVSRQAKDGEKSIGRKRWRAEFKLFALVQLTTEDDQAGLTVGDVIRRLQWDAWRAIDADRSLNQTAEALGYEKPFATGCEIDEFVNADPNPTAWDEGRFVAQGHLFYEEPLPPRM